MFSLLSPMSLWLGALLAVPLVIHFLGRQRLRKVPFPSLLLVEERFAKSMQRHRLKNLLLLLVRTLLILCLLLALMNPVLNNASAKSAARGGDVAAAAVLVHNGAYGLVPMEAGAAPDAGANGPAERDALGRQRRLVRELDSALGVRAQAVPLLADGAGLAEASARRGDYGEAAARLLAALDARTGETRAYLPAFAWEDLLPARQALIEALREHPGLRLVLWDFGEEGSRLSAFAAVKAVPSARDPSVTLRAFLAPSAAADGEPRLRTWIGDRVVQETRLEDAGGGDALAAETVLPLADGSHTAGRLSLGDAAGPARSAAGRGPAAGRFAGRRFAAEDWYFCFPNPGRLVLAHAGSSLASLPSLGRENYFRRIVHVAAARDLPLGGGSAAAGSAAAGGAAAGGSGARGALRLVYLSNERNTDAAAYGRIVEFVKRGGSLIVGVGRESDVPLLNRFLLQPLRMGRLGAVVTAPENARVEADAQALDRLGGLAAGASGAPGMVRGAPEAVRMRFAFAPDSGTDVLLRQGGEPVLAARRFHQGRVLLWTTDLDDLDWTDLGVSPLVPLLHQAFQEGAGGLTANRAAAPDSLLRLEPAEPGLRAEVRDPDGRPFTRVRSEGGRVRVGPFDKPGLHTAILGADTVVFAVNLEPGGPAQARDGQDWERWNLDRKAEFLKGFEPFKGRVLVARPEAGGALRASVRPLWKWLFLAAILLLFLEGIIASAYSSGSPGRKAA